MDGGAGLAPAAGMPAQPGRARVGGTPNDSALFALRLLAFLRVFAPMAQVLTLFVVTRAYEVRVPTAEVGALILIEIGVAALTWVRVLTASRISPIELFWQAQLDVALFALMLYFTGGSSNPFAPLFILPTAIVASALQPRYVWLVALTTMGAYAGLRYWHVPLFHPQGHTQVYDLHEDGMVINYVFTAALLTYFCVRMIVSLRERERMLANARDAQIRSESVVAIGALAAGHAHELSTPLATMAVVVSELQRQHATDPALCRDLAVLGEQVEACKRIVSNLAQAAGQPRSESAHGAAFDDFLRAIIERSRALHPGATIDVAFGSPAPAPMIVAEDTLRLAITNLVDNAARASPQQVRVEADWAGDELRVRVRDQGPGFPPELLHRLGKRLQSTRAPSQGMGLGLLLSAVTLERLGGRLELSNAPEGGALAVLRLPLHSILIESPSSHP